MPMPMSSRASHRVLLAEDNTTSSLVMRAIIERAGYHCTLVRDGEQALDKLVHETFDVAVLDVQMPRMSGLEVTRALRFMRPDTPRLPLILFSAESGAAMQEECLSAGADRFVAKPVSAAQFLATLSALLQQYDAERHVPDETAEGESVDMKQGDRTSGAVFDLKVLAELEKINPEPVFLDGLLAGFVVDNRAIVAELGSALRTHARELALDLLHALKGSALSVGAVDFGERCQHLHRLLLRGQEDGGEMMARVEQAFGQLVTAITDYRQQRLLVV